MNSLFSGLSSSFSTWATALATTIGSFSMPGCPRAQTPRALTPESDPNTTTPAVVVQESLLVTPQVRPVTIPTPEDESVLLP